MTINVYMYGCMCTHTNTYIHSTRTYIRYNVYVCTLNTCILLLTMYANMWMHRCQCFFVALCCQCMSMSLTLMFNYFRRIRTNFIQVKIFRFIIRLRLRRYEQQKNVTPYWNKYALVKMSILQIVLYYQCCPKVHYEYVLH